MYSYLRDTTLALENSANFVINGGNVGIGRTPTLSRLEVAGNASKTTASSWAANSDRRIKKNVEAVKFG
jgi:hypothetical protein